MAVAVAVKLCPSALIPAWMTVLSGVRFLCFPGNTVPGLPELSIRYV